jgi:DNA-directed RNA polymerase beta' subunit
MRRVTLATGRDLSADSVGLGHVSGPAVKAFVGHVFGREGGDATERDAARPAHVVLPEPVLHPLAMGRPDSPAALLLDLPDEELWRVQFAQRWVVVRAAPGGPLRVGQLLDEAEAAEAEMDLGEVFEARAGGEALAELLEGLDIPAAIAQTRAALATTPDPADAGRARARLALLERYGANGLDPGALALRVLPILPRALRRPGTPAADLDELYRNVLRVETRLALMAQQGAAPVMLQRNQYELTARAIEGLFANGRGGRLFTHPARRRARTDEEQRLFSLSDLLAAAALDVLGVFEGHAVEVDPGDDTAAILRATGLRLR